MNSAFSPLHEVSVSFMSEKNILTWKQPISKKEQVLFSTLNYLGIMLITGVVSYAFKAYSFLTFVALILFAWLVLKNMIFSAYNSGSIIIRPGEGIVCETDRFFSFNEFSGIEIKEEMVQEKKLAKLVMNQHDKLIELTPYLDISVCKNILKQIELAR